MGCCLSSLIHKVVPVATNRTRGGGCASTSWSGGPRCGEFLAPKNVAPFLARQANRSYFDDLASTGVKIRLESRGAVDVDVAAWNRGSSGKRFHHNSVLRVSPLL
jgi:hypothetical protein